jgi:membrane-bound lytic murein transglycosylase A
MRVVALAARQRPPDEQPEGPEAEENLERQPCHGRTSCAVERLGMVIGSRTRRTGSVLLASVAFALAGCASVSKIPPTQPVQQAPAACPAPQTTPAPLSWATSLRPSTFDAIPGWTDDTQSQAWSAFLRSCAALQSQPAWQNACTAAGSVDGADSGAVRRFFETLFTAYQVVNPDGSLEGTITGYYEPLIRGSRQRSAAYRYAVYGVPDDLLVVDLSEVYPDLKHMRLRGRLDGRRVVPYWQRADIEAGKAAVLNHELVWTDDAVELFFLQIQGSGQVRLDTGETIRLSYADQNGYPYRSVGRLLVEQGELTLDQASMQGIKAWAQRNPERLAPLLNQNASYVFFRETAVTSDGPTGALGVPLTAGRSVAVDPRAIPLGGPVFLSTTTPGTGAPLRRLMLAQDTGGAIRGAVRADFYWGSGAEAGAMAGRMRQSGQLWVLLPKDFKVSGDFKLSGDFSLSGDVPLAGG